MINEKIIEQTKEFILDSNLRMGLELIRKNLTRTSSKNKSLDLLTSRFQDLENKRIKGVISDENYALNKNKITSDFLDFLSVINEPDILVKDVPDHHRNNKKKYMIFAGLVLLILIALLFFFLNYLNNGKITNCDYIYKTAITDKDIYKKAKDCYEKYINELDELGNMRLLSCNYVTQGLEHFSNRDYRDAIIALNQIPDSEKANFFKGYIEDSNKILRAQTAENSGNLENSLAIYEELSEGDVAKESAEYQEYILDEIKAVKQKINEKNKRKRDCKMRAGCFYSIVKEKKTLLKTLSPEIKGVRVELNKKMLQPTCEPYLTYEFKKMNGQEYKGKRARAERKFILPYEVTKWISSDNISSAKFIIECENHELHDEYTFTK